MNTKEVQIKLGDLPVDIIYKDIKNLHLSVYPPKGRVKISAPLRMNPDTVRVFAISKLGWIRRQQEKFLNQKRQGILKYINRESHYYLGKRYLLKLVVGNESRKIVIKHDKIEMYVHEGTTIEKKEELMNAFYRQELKEIIPDIISKWQKIMNVEVNEFGIKKMKTKWGTCNSKAKRIWLNLELAKKSVDCIEYIIVHEMTHLLERNHNQTFNTYMNQYIPHWKLIKSELNDLVLSYKE